jgi:methionyl aminopeptidase
MFQTNDQIPLKSPRDLDKMREAGRILAKVFEHIDQLIHPGISTWDVDQAAYNKIVEMDSTPAFLNLYGFPASACISLNEELVHGIPSKDRVLKEGDILSVDMGVIHKGWYSDRAFTYAVGEVSDDARRLIDTTEASFWNGVANLKPGSKIGNAQNAIQSTIEAAKMHVVKKYVGHGIGRKLHEEPQLANYGPANSGFRVKPGMVFAIEPMVGIATEETKELEDGWTVIMADRSLSAHYEHTVAVTEDGPEILTWDPDMAAERLEQAKKK